MVQQPALIKLDELADGKLFTKTPAALLGKVRGVTPYDGDVKLDDKL